MNRYEQYDEFCVNLMNDVISTLQNKDEEKYDNIDTMASKGSVSSSNWLCLMLLFGNQIDTALSMAVRNLYWEEQVGTEREYLLPNEGYDGVGHLILAHELLFICLFIKNRYTDTMDLLNSIKMKNIFRDYTAVWDYWTGHCLQRQENYAEAYKYLLLSATNGNYRAMYELATLYGTGKGVVVDDSKAYEWASKAYGRRLSWFDEKICNNTDRCFNVMLLALFEEKRSNFDRARNLFVEAVNYNTIAKDQAQEFLDRLNAKNTTTNNNSSGGGCYIATCVYGSYDCPEVWTLRRFRDFTLDESVLGRLFIKVYYKISPRIVAQFGDNVIFRRCWRSVLDRMVKHLLSKGVSNTPYSDKY